jgi:hypothetical protein
MEEQWPPTLWRSGQSARSDLQSAAGQILAAIPIRITSAATIPADRDSRLGLDQLACRLGRSPVRPVTQVPVDPPARGRDEPRRFLGPSNPAIQDRNRKNH